MICKYILNVHTLINTNTESIIDGMVLKISQILLINSMKSKAFGPKSVISLMNMNNSPTITLYHPILERE